MNARPLAKIEADLEAAFRREAKGPIEIGGLLIEAKEQLDAHGKWLPWLVAKFPHSVRTAQDYMSAARFAAKYAMIAHLKITAGGLYALARIDSRDSYPNGAEIIKTALQEAESTWIGSDRVDDIDCMLNPPDPEPPDPDPGPSPSPSPSPSDGDDDGDGDDDDDADDRPPPPAPPPLNPKQARLVRDFDDAIAAFKKLVTKRAAEFVAAGAPSVDLELIANFLLQIAKERSRAKEEETTS